MKIHAIRDAYISKTKDLAWLLYYPHSREFHIEINDEIDEWEAPLLLSSFVKRGRYSVDPYFSRMWVELRIIPPDRQNLGMILRDNGLDEYDPYQLLVLANGRCAQDDCYIVKLKEDQIPDMLKKRLRETLVTILPLPESSSDCANCCTDTDTGTEAGLFADSEDEDLQTNTGYLVFFRDGMIRTITSDEIFSDPMRVRQWERLIRYGEMLSNDSIQTEGHGLQLGNNVFVSAAELRQKGSLLPITKDLFRNYIQQNVIDTQAAAAILQCTRQNIQNLVRRNRLTHVLVTNNNYLFLREDVLSLL